MPYRIEVAHRPETRDVRGESVCEDIRKFLNMPVDSVATVDVFLVDLPVSDDDSVRIKDEILSDSVLHLAAFDKCDTGPFDWCIEVAYKPGVTDNLGRTSKEAVSDMLDRKFTREEKVYSSKQFRLTAPELTPEQADNIGHGFLGNTLIENISVQSYDEWRNSTPVIDPPKIKGRKDYNVGTHDLNISDEALMKLSNEGTLSLSIEEMHALRNYFGNSDIRAKRREQCISEDITDVELECLAQTWSEHCKHKIFNSLIEYTEEGRTETIDSVFKTYIKGSTDLIGTRVTWLLSIFVDNAGVIKFNDKLSIVYKVETHNSPSALEPYGGALTGIVGVNRDPMGTGMGAELLFNVWGYCFGSPFYDKEMPPGLLHPNRIREGVHKGVIDGGNQSGIPYSRGWEYFDERYRGKPLVFCGTVGLMPAELNGKPSHEKGARPGDLIVMAGGRIGKDGIHGATFSSAELTEDSPVQAVQIGDPITQKKMYDFLMEARNLGLFTCNTDNGAGGLSSSVGEMAEFSGGCYMDLTGAPLKYDGLDPWEILISEAQERMTLAVDPTKRDELFTLAEQREVELTALGQFTDTGYFHVVYDSKTVAFIDMDFLHDGIPQMKLKAEWIPPVHAEPDFEEPADLDSVLKDLLGSLNICSIEGKSRKYDHEVKGLSVIKPFVGINRDVPSDASVMMVEHDSFEGIVLAEGKNPRYADIDAYDMAASSIDEAVRRVIAAGGTLDHLAGLDNFCWPDPVESEKTPDGKYKLAQLVRANKAVYDITTVYNVPCISGKDSMKNDTIMENRKISIPPTLLYSVIGKIDDIRKSVTMDIKRTGDIVYVLGDTNEELGSSEYYQMMGERKTGAGFTGNNVPKVNAEKAKQLYRAVEKITEEELANSIHTPTIGGLGVALAKTAFAGDIGIEADLGKVPSTVTRNDNLLFSESNSRFIVTVSPENKAQFEALLSGCTFAEVGMTTEEKSLKLTGLNGSTIINSSLDELRNAWKFTLKDFFHGES